MARITKESPMQMYTSEEKKRQRAITQEIYLLEARLHDLMSRGAHKVRADITERYENRLTELYKQYRPEILEGEEL